MSKNGQRNKYSEHHFLFKEIEDDIKKVGQELKRILTTEDPVLSQTCLSLFQTEGKWIRPGFTLLSGRFFEYRYERLQPLAIALELIHMAALIHDDVVDDSLMRRGQPTLVAGWGVEVSVATGNFLLAKALEQIALLNNNQISALLAQVCIEMCKGEILQLQESYDIKRTFKQYYHCIKRKTALLFSLSCKLGALVSQANKRQIWVLKNFGHWFGIAFQIVDDILDITADADVLGKPSKGDLRQGVITLPMIYALHNPVYAKRLQVLLSKTEKKENEIKEAVYLIKKAKGVDRAREKAELCIEKAIKNLAELPSSPVKDAFIELAYFLGERSYQF